jgi:hypothetical protein
MPLLERCPLAFSARDSAGFTLDKTAHSGKFLLGWFATQAGTRMRAPRNDVVIRGVQSMATKIPTAVDLLKEDHEKVKRLFEQFESAKSQDEKEEIADQVDLELRVHSMIEEEVLYPAFKDIDGDAVAESFEEHGVVEELLNELATMDLEDDQFAAKFKVMKENVEHHIEEEETEMFPKCPSIPNYEELGLIMAERKQKLLVDLREMDDSERATTSGDPATMRASGKSEAVMAGEAPKEPRPRSRSKASSRRSSRAKATSKRKKAA